ncbi:DUF3883 domain-containing protein [bacterium]|nr:DUF3883 domain-containing protein [candidate division CSSED10-310 bacterium]
MSQTHSDNYPEQIKNLRNKLKLTQVEFAERLGVSFPTVNRWENGKSNPSPLSWQRILELSNEFDTTRQTDRDPIRDAADTAPPMLDFTAEPDIVRTIVEGERLSFGHLANPIFATEISRIDPLPHQRIAVYDRMLTHPRLRYLLADDAGAGKTIMTGLYIREMLSRRLLSRILIVPPAGLVGNWQEELLILFNLRFTVASGSDARKGNPFTGPDSDRLIVSVDTLAGERVFSRLQEDAVEPYDLVVFDEAHKLSCDRGNDYRIRKTARYKLAEAIAGAAPGDATLSVPWCAHHLLLLTATPHMGKDYPYYALWRLLEPTILTTIEAFENFPPDKRRDHFIRRTKEEMVHLDGRPLYPSRKCDTLGYDLTTGAISEQRLYEATTDYLLHVYNKAKILNQSAARLAMGVFQRRLASSTYALLCSFQRRIGKLDQIIDDIMTGRITIEELLTRQLSLRDDDDPFESKGADEESTDGDMEENEAAEDNLLQGVIAESLVELVAEREQVIALRDLARQVYEGGMESKFDKLREVLTASRFANEKVLIFTEHRDTMNFLVRRFEGLGFAGQLAHIHGGMHYTDRRLQIEKFRKTKEQDGARLMVCTDAAAEGVNLQFCWIMVNYDIPWNPARLEQRMGRIHRYGQKHDPVCIVNLVAPATREGRVLKTLLEKLEKIRAQLNSEKVFDSIGRVFMGVSIKHYMERALLEDSSAVAGELDCTLTKEQVLAIEQRERCLYGEGGDVKKELPRLREADAHDTFFRLLPGFVRSFIEAAARHVGMDVVSHPDDCFDLVPARDGAVDPLPETLDVCIPGAPRLMSVQRPKDRDGCIWMHPGEPVYERFHDLVRQELGDSALHGAIFVDPTAEKPYLFHLARLEVVRSADPDIAELAHEELLDCRLVGIRQSEGSDIAECPLEHLLLLRGGVGLPAQAQRLAAKAAGLRDQAMAYLMESVCRTLVTERRDRMMTGLVERESFVARGFDYKEAELATARSKLGTRARAGNTGAAAELSRIKSQQKDLSTRRDQVLQTIRREPELIAPGAVVFIAHALVVPSSDPSDLEQLETSVEWIAMNLAKAREEDKGATVHLVHTPKLAREAGLPPNPGFDLLSIRPDGTRRCIEVKGRAGIGEIELSDNEWARAANLREEYWVYAVYHCATNQPHLVCVRDPFHTLLGRMTNRTLEVTRTISAVINRIGVRIPYQHIVEAGEA